MGPASFQGVPFFVDTSEFSGGRRAVRHEYPLRDQPFIEDLGRKARAFTVDGYVLGDDYLTQRDRLWAALEQSGPGELIHPYYGTRRVQVTDFRIRESNQDGGMARFSISFEETQPTQVQPTSQPDTSAAAQASADAARQASYAFYTAQYRVAGAPTWTFAPIANVVSSAVGAVRSALAPFVTATQTLASLQSQAVSIETDALSLVETPASVVSSVDNFAAFLDGLTYTPQMLSGLIGAYGFGAPDRPAATTPTKTEQQTNFDATQRLLQQAIAIQAAKMAPTVTFDSYEDAAAMRDAITSLLDDQMLTVNDDAYPAFLQLRADLVKAVPGADSDLPHLVSYTPHASIPSIVLAYRLYGSVDLEADILARNKISNPAFVLGGRPLEVLSDG